MKLVLINHAVECPICDKGGECELQNLTHALGIKKCGPGRGGSSPPGSDYGPTSWSATRIALSPAAAAVRICKERVGAWSWNFVHTGLLHPALQRRTSLELRILRLLHRHLSRWAPDQQSVEVPGPGQGSGQDRNRLSLLWRRLQLFTCTPKTAKSCGRAMKTPSFSAAWGPFLLAGGGSTGPAQDSVDQRKRCCSRKPPGIGPGPGGPPSSRKR